MAATPKTVAFGLNDRMYDAICTNVQQQLISPSNAEEMERTNLSFTVFNIKPWDLQSSGLLVACFRPKGGNLQTVIETALKGQAKVEAEYNQKFEVLALDKGVRHDEDATHRLIFEVVDGPMADSNGAYDGGYLRPASGIMLKSVKASANQIDGDPRVDIEIIAKGFDYFVGGYGWLISSFSLGFQQKSAPELEIEGAEANEKKAKKNKDQGDLPIEN